MHIPTAVTIKLLTADTVAFDMETNTGVISISIAECDPFNPQFGTSEIGAGGGGIGDGGANGGGDLNGIALRIPWVLKSETKRDEVAVSIDIPCGLLNPGFVPESNDGIHLLETHCFPPIVVHVLIPDWYIRIALFPESATKISS